MQSLASQSVRQFKFPPLHPRDSSRRRRGRSSFRALLGTKDRPTTAVTRPAKLLEPGGRTDRRVESSPAVPLCEADRSYANSNNDADGRPHKNRILRAKRADLWDSVDAVVLAPPSGAGARLFERGAGCRLQRVGRPPQRCDSVIFDSSLFARSTPSVEDVEFTNDVS